MRPRTGELRALTGARGIAAWFVVLFHIRQSIAGVPAPLARLFDKGYLAVDFFFLLSGFVIWLSWGDRLRDERWAAVGPFLRKRVERVWPLHAVLLAATVALALLFVATGRADPAAFPFADLPLNVVLLQNWGFTDHLAWNVPSWSISAELGAYLVFPAVAIMVDWRRRSTPALLAIAALLLLGLYVATGAAPTLGEDIARTGLIRCLCEFLVGTIVCTLWQRGVGKGGATIVAGMLMALWALGVPETLAVPALFAALLFLLATAGAAHPLARRVAHYLGDISYATYLCHYPLWIAFKLAFVSDPRDVPLPLIAVFLAIVFACSALLYRHVERPAQRLMERLGRSPQPAGAIP